jgi:putative DNA primase/helicase
VNRDADIRELARQLGGTVAGPRSVTCPGPGHSPRDRSLSISFSVGEFVVYSHAGDDWQTCRDHVRGLLGLERWRPERQPETRQPAPMPEASDDDETERTAAALRIWGEARDPRGTLVERYLAGRGIDLGHDLAGRVLRYHPRLWHRESQTSWPGMVGLMTDLRTDRPTGIHRTFLAPDGSGKAPIDRPKKMLGRAAGSAIKLDADDLVELGLVVSEGIETGLAGRQLGYQPTWALGSAGAIGALPVLGGIEALTILGENDASGTNARESMTCAKRWTTAGADVSVLEPLEGKDANDVLTAVAK